MKQGGGGLAREAVAYHDAEISSSQSQSNGPVIRSTYSRKFGPARGRPSRRARGSIAGALRSLPRLLLACLRRCGPQRGRDPEDLAHLDLVWRD